MSEDGGRKNEQWREQDDNQDKVERIRIGALNNEQGCRISTGYTTGADR